MKMDPQLLKCIVHLSITELFLDLLQTRCALGAFLCSEVRGELQRLLFGEFIMAGDLGPMRENL